MRTYRNDVYHVDKNSRSYDANIRNKKSKDEYFVERLFAGGNSRFIREPFEFSTANTISPFSLLEAYYKICLKTRPYIKSSKRTVLLKPKATPEALFTAVNLFKFSINYKGVILDESESVDKHGVADKTAFQVIKKYIPPIYDKIKYVYKEIDDLSQYTIKDCVDTGVARSAINLTSKKLEDNSTLDHKTAILNERNFKEYMQMVRTKILETEGFLEELLKLAVPEKYNAIMGRFIKISTKIFFDIPGVKDELNIFMQNKDFKTLYRSRFTSKKANSTAAMVVVNYNRFMDVSRNDYSKCINNEQVSFIAYEVGNSKKEAKNRAICTFLINAIPELVPEESRESNNRDVRSTKNETLNEINIKEEIRTQTEYEKIAIDDPEVLIVENGFKTNTYEHKNPMSLLNEIFSKLYKTSLSSVANFEKLESSELGINMELTYKTFSFKVSGRTKKIAENLLCLQLIKKMFPGVELYYQLVLANKDTSQLNRFISIEFISEDSEVSINYIQNLVRNELGKKQNHIDGKRKKEVKMLTEYSYHEKNSMNWVEIN